MSSAEPPDAISGQPVLLEAARQRLVTIAADVLGLLAADELPAALRPIARFAPGKRARLGASALAAALDADAGFRARVAAVVEESTPQLVDAVRSGATTAASDPLDVAVVAYLVRADGWVDAVTGANLRWAAERGGATGEVDELARLRQEVAELRTRRKAEAARRRDAVAAAGEQQAAELADAKRQLRARTAELRAAEQAREAAAAAAAKTAQELAALRSAHDAELRRARARITELERAAETTRREARSSRDVDDARLWLLVDTVTEAAAGIRRELSLPLPPAIRPGDSVASAAAAGVSRRADDPVAVERLLALPNVHLIIDGYNVTKTGYGDLALADQRNRLIGAMAALAGRSGAEITIAFDGGVRPPAQPPAPRGVRVLFSAQDEIADDLIRRLVAAEPAGRPVVVVSSDRQVASDVQRAGAWAVPSVVLLAMSG